jgi:serine protease Do
MSVPCRLSFGGILLSWIVAGIMSIDTVAQEPLTREQKVREDRRKVEAEGFWIYNDLQRAFSEARETGKPILIVLRCIPCEECVKLDDDLVDGDPVIRPLLEQFVCVRVVSTNGLDLSLFQFDTDQSFATFLMNADGVIYGRFGTRSHRHNWDGDVSLTGLAEALRGALALHRADPRDREALAAKRGPEPEFASPEQFPTLRERYTSRLSDSSNIVQSCIHCHQIGDAQRDHYRRQGRPMPDELLFPYPHPKSIGLIMDPETRGTVATVELGSLAADAGFHAGDEMVRMNGQPLLSIADIQWVLHGVSNQGGAITVDVRRGGELLRLTLSLPSDWRLAGDIQWRVSSWGLRRMVTGGLVLEPLSEDQRQSLGIPEGDMALQVRHVGQWGEHAAAKREGFQENDVLIEVDGRRDLPRESDLFRLGVQERKPSDRLRVVLLRDGRQRTLQLPQQP